MYALVDVHGRTLDVGDDFHTLMREGGSSVIGFEKEHELVPNALTPEQALKVTRLPPLDWDEVMRTSPKEAQMRLRPYFQVRRWEDSKKFHNRFGAKSHYWPPSTQFDQPASMAEALIGSNYKLSKNKDHAEYITPRLPPAIRSRVLAADVWGLNLVPATQPRDLIAYMQENADANGEVLARHGLTTIGRKTIETMPPINLCAGSSKECRQACLVYAGQNGAAFYNTVIKLARTHALLGDPVAFMRMLVLAIEKFERRARGEGSTPYFRMNVLSDIPWEIWAPGIFDRFPRLQFYDYTKVPGRRPPKNYDLTFSFSGTNMSDVQSEIRTRRVTFVFLLPVGYDAAMDYELPKRFLGLPVVDGDLSDVRPLDPQKAIVGLRWKIPMGQAIDPKKTKMKFVIECKEVDGHFVAATTPGADTLIDSDQEAP